MPKIRDEPIREVDPGFTSRNTSGLNATELVALDRALGRLMSTGLSEYEAKRALHVAVAEWLQPSEAAEAALERLLAWR